MEASNKKTMKDSEFTINQTEGDSSIKTFSQLMNSSSNHLQNLTKTINTFKELNKKPQPHYDNQARTYLTSNDFQMKLISSKEYFRVEKELKQILQHIIQVQQQAQDGEHTQKTEQNKIIAELTGNIQIFSDLLEKSKNLISLEKTYNDIEYKSKKSCNQHLGQLKDSLNDCVNNLEKFLERNQMNSQINQIGKVQNQATKLSKQSVHQINQNNKAENKVKDQIKKGNQQMQLFNQQLKLEKLTQNQLKQTVIVIQKQLRGMITKTKQNWLYKHFQMGVKEERNKKKRSEQKNELIIKQSQVKQHQMVNMIDFMNEFIVSLASSTYSELLTVKTQFLKMEMINKNQHPQKHPIIYLQEVGKLLDKMNNDSYNQQNEFKQKIQQLIESQTQESCKKNIAECEAKYKIAVENQIKIKDKQINELNQQLQNALSSLNKESQKLKTLNTELESKKQQIQQLKDNTQKNSIESNKRFEQEKQKLEGSIKQKQQKIKDIQNKLQNQKSKIKTLQKQQLQFKNHNNDTNNDYQATFQQNDKLKRLLQENKRELNTAKSSVALKESELSKFKQQLNNSNSSIQSLKQQIFNHQLIITQLNHQLSIKNQQINNLTNTINQIQSQSTTKISSLTQQLSTKTSQLQDIQSNFNQQKQQKQFETIDFPETNSQIQKLQEQRKRFLQISDIHKQQQQSNQNTIKSLTQTNQSNTEKINSLQNDKQNLTIQLTKLNQNFIKIKTQNKEKLNQLNLQSNHLSTQFECQKSKNQANQKQITELKESVEALTEQNTKHQLVNCQMKIKIQIQNLLKEQKQLKSNLTKKENEIQVNLIDLKEKLTNQQKLNAENSVKIKSLTDQLTQLKNMIEVRDTQIRGLKENCKLMGNHIITLQKVQTQKEKLDVHVIELNKKIQDLQQQCDKYSRQITQISESNSQLQTKLCAKIQRLKEREIQIKSTSAIQQQKAIQ